MIGLLRRIVLAAFVLAVLSLVVFQVARWLGGNGLRRPASGLTEQQSAVADSISKAGPPTSKSVAKPDENPSADTRGRTLVPRHHRAALVASYESTDDLRLAMAQWQAQALAGDADASFMQVKALEECQQVIAQFEFLDSEVHTSMDQSRVEEVVAYDQIVAEGTERCRGFLDDADALSSESLERWQALAVAQGSLAARMVSIREAYRYPYVWDVDPQADQARVEAAQQLIVESLEVRDTLAVFEIGNLVSSLSFADEERLGHHPRHYDERPLWHLVACDFGYPCGPGSSSLRNACLMYGACGYTDLEQAYQQAVFLPRDWQRLNARRYQIHQALYAGQFDLGIVQ